MRDIIKINMILEVKVVEIEERRKELRDKK